LNWNATNAEANVPRSVRGREIVPRTPIRHGFGDPLKPLVGQLAAPDELTFPVSTAWRNRQNYLHDDVAGLRARRAKEHRILFADCASRVMPEEPGPNVRG